MSNKAAVSIEMGNSIRGMFKVEKMNIHTKKIEEVAPWQDNLILNRGMNDLAINSIFTWSNTLSVGSGSTPPQIDNTGLEAKVAQAPALNSYGQYSYGTVSTGAPYGWVRRTYQFAAGAAAGNISELGLKSGSNDNINRTRALIKDSSGNPTTITVLPDEILIVTYEIRVYVDMTDKTYNTTIKNVPTVVTIRPTEITSTINWFGYNQDMGFTMWLYGLHWYHSGTGLGVGPTSGIPSGTQISFSDVQAIKHAYVADSYKLETTCSISVLNAAGLTITGAKPPSGHSAIPFQIGFSPGFLKTDSETVRLRVAVSWARYTP